MIAYLEKFLALVERFVIATEKRNELLSQSKGTLDSAVKELADSKNEPAETGSASTGSVGDAATSTSGRRNRSRAGAADTNTAEDTKGAGEDTGAGATGGRRQRSRAGSTNEAETEKSDAGSEGTASSGRRQRSRAAGAGDKAPEVVPDTPEQADDRAEIENLCQLCGDIDEATADVKAFFAEKGWSTATDIPAAELEAALNELNIIADKYFD